MLIFLRKTAKSSYWFATKLRKRRARLQPRLSVVYANGIMKTRDLKEKGNTRALYAGFVMQIVLDMDDNGGRDKIRSNTSCRQPASGRCAYSRPVHSSALHQVAPVTQYPNDVYVTCGDLLLIRCTRSRLEPCLCVQLDISRMSLQIFVTSIFVFTLILVTSKVVSRKISFSDSRMIVDHIFIGITNLNKRLQFFTTFENNWDLPFFEIGQSNFFRLLNFFGWLLISKEKCSHYVILENRRGDTFRRLSQMLISPIHNNFLSNNYSQVYLKLNLDVLKVISLTKIAWKEANNAFKANICTILPAS